MYIYTQYMYMYVWVSLELTQPCICTFTSCEVFNIISIFSSPSHLIPSLLQQEQEPIILQRIQQAVDDVKTKASEEKQKVLMDASRQLREALKEANAQSSSKEVRN